MSPKIVGTLECVGGFSPGRLFPVFISFSQGSMVPAWSDSLFLLAEPAPGLTSLYARLGTTIPFPHSSSSTAGYFLSREDKKSQAEASCLASEESRPASGPVGSCCGPVCAGWNLATMSGMVCVHSLGPIYIYIWVQIPEGGILGFPDKG